MSDFWAVGVLLCVATQPLAAQGPTIAEVTSTAEFGGAAAVSPGSYIRIEGASLASRIAAWIATDSEAEPPVSLEDVSVAVAGQPASVHYVSPGLIVALLSPATPSGVQPLTVTNAGGISAPYPLTVVISEAALWAPASFRIGGRQYAAALFPDFRTFVLPPGAIPGVLSRQARPGETIIVLGTGFGAATPVFSFGETAVTPSSSVPMPSGAGLYRFDLVVPSIPDSDVVPLSFTADNVPCNQALFTAVKASARTGIRTEETIWSGGILRSYVLYRPFNFQPGRSALVLHLHGHTGTAPGQESWTHWDDLADREGFAIAYPQGLIDYGGSTGWNFMFNSYYWVGPEPDDVGFLRELIDSLQASLRPDPKRIFMTGHSAGAHMTHRAAVELSTRIAAVAPVMGSLYRVYGADPRIPPPPAAPVSALLLNGDSDTAVQYCGFTSSETCLASQDRTFDYWAASNGCTTYEPAANLCDGFTPTAISQKRATNCLDGTEVQIYKLIGGIHTWYWDPMNDPARIPYNPAFNAETGLTLNELIWKFFAAHPKP